MIAVDLDPQANLSAMFLDDRVLEGLWGKDRELTLFGAISPIFRGVGDISPEPHLVLQSEGLAIFS
jgi:chromosome partitioning protein